MAAATTPSRDPSPPRRAPRQAPTRIDRRMEAVPVLRPIEKRNRSAGGAWRQVTSCHWGWSAAGAQGTIAQRVRHSASVIAGRPESPVL